MEKPNILLTTECSSVNSKGEISPYPNPVCMADLHISKMPQVQDRPLGDGLPFVSVVVPTYNRWTALERTLTALCAQDYPAGSYEIIVADDCSSDSTDVGVRRLAEYSSVPILYVCAASRSGPGASRNLGISHARGDIIALTDGDTLPVPQWISSAVAAFLGPGEGHVDAVEGAVLPLEGVKVSPFSSVVSNRAGGRYQCCSMFYRKTAIQQAGGFDERLFDTTSGVHFREDLDLALTIIKGGGSIRFVPEAIAFHPPHQPSLRQPLDFMKRYIHDPLLMRKHTGRWRSRIDPFKFGPIRISMPRHKLYALHLICVVLTLFGVLASNETLFRVTVTGAITTGTSILLLHWRICRRPAFAELVLSIPIILVCPYAFALSFGRGWLRAKRLFQ